MDNWSHYKVFKWSMLLFWIISWLCWMTWDGSFSFLVLILLQNTGKRDLLFETKYFLIDKLWRLALICYKLCATTSSIWFLRMFSNSPDCLGSNRCSSIIQIQSYMCEFILDYNNYSTFLLILNELFKYLIPLERAKERTKERSVE